MIDDYDWQPIGPDMGGEYVMLRWAGSGSQVVGRRVPEASYMLEDAGGQIVDDDDRPVDEWRPLTTSESVGLAAILRIRARNLREQARRISADAEQCVSRT